MLLTTHTAVRGQCGFKPATAEKFHLYLRRRNGQSKGSEARQQRPGSQRNTKQLTRSILPGVGTAVSINKINGLAWTVLAIANSTENALTMVNDEMRQIRDAVIQNRLVIDVLTSEKGGVCKMLGLSCCFHIPDYSDNVTNIITHMRMAVK